MVIRDKIAKIAKLKPLQKISSYTVFEEFLFTLTVYKNVETREQYTNEIHALITVFMIKLVQFVSYNVKPISVLFESNV